jgi:predicted MPP superfamily phosphohydrolase
VPWFSECLGKLSSRYGVYCIFGNHELRIGDTELLVRAAGDARLKYVGRRWQAVKIHGQTVVLAGNELPWLKPAPDLSECPPVGGNDRPFRILLSHSPDQFGWARRADFDLMLAGHTHGGQIRLPVIGALVGESRYGVKYCGSLYYDCPTLLHVSRGLSGCQNLRINCRPELAKLVLRCGTLKTVRDPAFVLPPKYLPQPETAVGRSG